MAEQVKSTTYRLRPAVASGLGTGRSQLIQLEIGQLKEGRELYANYEVVELLKVIRDLVHDREVLRHKLESLELRLKDTIQNIHGNVESLETVLEEVSR